jgi:1-deoxy-D-xylulose-5-phosphate reductoisomerase
VYNAANEIAVQAFLENRIRFPEIAVVVETAMQQIGVSEITDMNDVSAADAAARVVAHEIAVRLGKERVDINS